MTLLRNWMICFLMVVCSFPSFAALDDEKSDSMFGGPSFHLGVGLRTKKAPNLDEYHTMYGLLKISLFSLHFSDQGYVSLLGIGITGQRAIDGIFIVPPTFTPVTFYSSYGVGIGVDLFSVNSKRDDRPGGPFGVSLSFDVLQITKMISKMM